MAATAIMTTAYLVPGRLDARPSPQHLVILHESRKLGLLEGLEQLLALAQRVLADLVPGQSHEADHHGRDRDVRDGPRPDGVPARREQCLEGLEGRQDRIDTLSPEEEAPEGVVEGLMRLDDEETSSCT